MVNSETAKDAKKPVVEAVKNCAGCNKPIKRHNRYYRNGKYYCTLKCCKTTNKKTADEAQAGDQKEGKKE